MPGGTVRLDYRMLLDLPGVTKEAVEAALKDVVEVCLDDANRTIPHEDGVMQDSGFTQVDGLEGQVGYSTPYTVIQHEDASLRHDEGRRSHWLEQTVNERSQAYSAYIAAEVRRRLGA